MRLKISRIVNEPQILNEDGIYRIDDGTFAWYLPNPDVDKYYVCRCFMDKYDRYPDCLESGDTLLKVGAATGEDIRQASKNVGSNGTVYAIEAEPDNFRCLKENIKLHGMDNVETRQVAVSKTEGEEVRFSKHNSSHTTHRVSKAPLMKPEEEYGTLILKTTTVDDIVDEHNIDSIKMLSVTVNRYEGVVLSGATKTLENTEFVVIPINDEERGDAVEVLESAGFHCIEEGHVGHLFQNSNLV